MARKTYLFALMFCLTGMAMTVQAQKPYRLPDSKIGSWINRLADSAKAYDHDLNKGLRKSEFYGGGKEQRILRDSNQFKISTLRLKERFDRDRYDNERALSDDIRLLLHQATNVNKFMVSNFGRTGADERWKEVKQNLELLAQGYNVYWSGFSVSNRPRRMDDQDAKELLERIRDDSVLLHKGMESYLKLDRKIDHYTQKDTNEEIKHFIGLASRLRKRVDDKDGGTPNFDEMMRSAAKINNFIYGTRNRLPLQIKEDWREIYVNLRTLSSGYKVSPGAYGIPSGYRYGPRPYDY